VIHGNPQTGKAVFFSITKLLINVSSMEESDENYLTLLFNLIQEHGNGRILVLVTVTHQSMDALVILPHLIRKLLLFSVGNISIILPSR